MRLRDDVELLQMKVAVILAYNPKNAGMYSVDMAAQRFFRNSGHDYKLYRVLHGRKGPFFMNGGRLLRLTDPGVLMKADAIVYWGDFLNNPVYATEDFHIREQYYARGQHDVGKSLETWKEYYLLKGVDKGSRKVVSVSNNFQSAGRVLDSLDETTAREIPELLGRFDGIFPRDPASTQEVMAMLGTGSATRVENGVDAAVLNRAGAKRERKTRKTFTWFFHRSELSKSDELRIVSAVANATGLEPVHLGSWLRLNYLTWDRQFSRMVSQMAESAFCLSDTYHCLINAMVKDTPVIGVGRQASVQQGTLGDFKKRELFAMFDLGSWYVEIEPEGISEEAIGQVVAGAQRIQHNGAEADLYATLDQKAAAYRDLLQSVLA